MTDIFLKVFSPSNLSEHCPQYSPGGFAHVYLVRTATPVYNTTHHVLKRIAVPYEKMLTEVKQEVDVMVRKSHRNHTNTHVYDRDYSKVIPTSFTSSMQRHIGFRMARMRYLSSWNSAQVRSPLYRPNLTCNHLSGGGIIDMMNRRLRERLTEAEILTIFVDVCEGVAHMHNARPALLHRDLKVSDRD